MENHDGATVNAFVGHVHSFGFGDSSFGIWQLRFMENLLGLDAVHWDHEPVRNPLNRPPDTFSPLGE